MMTIDANGPAPSKSPSSYERRSQLVAHALEERIEKLTKEKLEITEKLARSAQPLQSFEQSLRTALTFLAEPWKLWDSERIEHKRAVLKLAFAGHLQYARNEGFRTADLALPFMALANFSAGGKGMVGATGIESFVYVKKPWKSKASANSSSFIHGAYNQTLTSGSAGFPPRRSGAPGVSHQSSRSGPAQVLVSAGFRPWSSHHSASGEVFGKRSIQSQTGSAREVFMTPARP